MYFVDCICNTVLEWTDNSRCTWFRKSVLAISCVLILIISSNCLAQQICNTPEPFQKVATASIWQNLISSRGSLRFEIKKIFNGVFAEVGEKKLLLKSVPLKYLEKSEDLDYCNGKLKDSIHVPYVYKPEPFDDVDDLSDWVEDFSEGSGKTGRDLYKRCDKSCSPQYRYVLRKSEENKIELEASVICGLPRDQDDNLYILTATCE